MARGSEITSTNLAENFEYPRTLHTPEAPKTAPKSPYREEWKISLLRDRAGRLLAICDRYSIGATDTAPRGTLPRVQEWGTLVYAGIPANKTEYPGHRYVVCQSK